MNSPWWTTIWGSGKLSRNTGTKEGSADVAEVAESARRTAARRTGFGMAHPIIIRNVAANERPLGGRTGFLEQVHHVVDDRGHGGPGAVRIPRLDRGKDGVVGGEAGGSALEAVGESDRGSKRGRDDVPELAVEGVSAGLEHGDVEGDVGFEGVVRAPLRRFHP